MGTIQKITCKSCGNSWQCHTGCGLRHSSLEAVSGLFPEPVRAEIRGVLQREMFPAFDFEFRIAYCPSCNSFESVPALDLRDGRFYTGVCDTCGREVKLAETIEKMHCPSCGGQSLAVLPTGHWD